MITLARVLASFILWATAAHAAGPLNPPAGPVASSHKTLTEVEPRIAINTVNTPGDANSVFKISKPGSYYLVGNASGTAGKHGIEIDASGVTIDLNGFELAGVPGMGLFDGVHAAVAGLTNIAVVNGSVRDWGKDGINLGDNSATGCRVEGVHARGNLARGIFGGVNSIITRCTASGGQTGIYVRSGSIVADCSATANSSFGIATIEGCIVTRCVSYANAGTGFLADIGSVVVGCSALSNALDGIQCSTSCIIRGNICTFNGLAGGDGAGIHATGKDNRIEENNCIGADRGIDVDGAGNFIVRNSCSGNTSDWEIAAHNIVGPILDQRAPASAAISGFSAPSSLGSADANANFSY